ETVQAGATLLRRAGAAVTAGKGSPADERQQQHAEEDRDRERPDRNLFSHRMTPFLSSVSQTPGAVRILVGDAPQLIMVLVGAGIRDEPVQNMRAVQLIAVELLAAVVGGGLLVHAFGVTIHEVGVARAGMARLDG